MHVQKLAIFTTGIIFKISDNNLMWYNSFVSIPCHVAVLHSSLRLKEITYTSGAENFHSLACQTTHISHVLMITLKTQDHKLKRKKKERKGKNQLRYRWKRKTRVQNVKRGGIMFIQVVLKGKQYPRPRNSLWLLHLVSDIQRNLCVIWHSNSPKLHIRYLILCTSAKISLEFNITFSRKRREEIACVHTTFHAKYASSQQCYAGRKKFLKAELTILPVILD